MRRGCVVSNCRTVVNRERFLSPWGALDVGNSQAGNAGAVTLEQLIALGDEMAALVKAGVPLEEGLTEFARDMPGQPGKLAKMLGERMSAGESLPHILASEPDQFPPVWRAVVEAGLKSGQLAAALESMSTTARRVAETRRLVARPCSTR